LSEDHSTPLGFYRALAQRHQASASCADAHLDLRKAFEGFTYSHASIMFNALAIPEVENIVSVGIRDFCEEERPASSPRKNFVYACTGAPNYAASNSRG
jgi:agmatinase